MGKTETYWEYHKRMETEPFGMVWSLTKEEAKAKAKAKREAKEQAKRQEAAPRGTK